MTLWWQIKCTVGVLLFLLIPSAADSQHDNDPFGRLAIYNGAWTVRAAHPWSGRAPGSSDHLVSRCHRFTAFFACEQTVNDKALGLIVYTVGSSASKLHARFIAPDGLAGGRGDLQLDGNHWTYLDKPPQGLTGNWSRVENYILDNDHISFEEYESEDQGETWTKTNSGQEDRDA